MHIPLYLYQILFRINRETRGAVAVEYTFLLIFIAIIFVLAVSLLAGELRDYFGALGNSFGQSAKQS